MAPTAAQKKAAAAKKAKAAAKVDTNTGLGTPVIEKTDAIQFKSRATGSKYDPILDQAMKLKKGETLKIPVPNPTPENLVALRNRLGAVVRRVVAPAVKGKVRLRVTQDNHLAISVE